MLLYSKTNVFQVQRTKFNANLPPMITLALYGIQKYQEEEIIDIDDEEVADGILF